MKLDRGEASRGSRNRKEALSSLSFRVYVGFESNACLLPVSSLLVLQILRHVSFIQTFSTPSYPLGPFHASLAALKRLFSDFYTSCSILAT